MRATAETPRIAWVPMTFHRAARFYDVAGSWVPLGIEVPSMAGSMFLVTRAGSHMRSVALDPDASVGIVEIDSQGASWRTVWGFKGGGMPTSELPSHVLIAAARSQATEGESRVLYHAHPSNVVALSAVLPLDARTFTRTLWKTMTECIIACPQGIGVVPGWFPAVPPLREKRRSSWPCILHASGRSTACSVRERASMRRSD